MHPLIAQITNLPSQDIGTNKINSFLPYRKGAKEFDFDAVGCSVLSCLMGRELKRNYTFDKYKAECLKHLKEKLSDDSVLGAIEAMYFTHGTIAKTAPEFMLIRSQGKGNASTKHLISLFFGFCRGRSSQIKFDSGTNFIEKIFLGILNNNLQEGSYEDSDECYLPFVAESFYRDVTFLSKHPDYFLEQLSSCIELYTFIYCTQLGLNIRNWTDGEPPESKPLYFILDTEKASSERSNLVKFGYQSVARPMSEVFPILSMLEHFNNDVKFPKAPLWAFASSVRNASEQDQQTALAALSAFAEVFRKKRALPAFPRVPISAIEAMQQIVGYGIMQFAEGTGRFRVQTQYMEVFDKGVAKSFIQARGRAGKVLVVNQDFVLLLTNLSIGYRKSLRFQELLAEFRSRGFWFDKSSQQALISFYERVGNVDRMSDSGDAVYVRNTI
jgi:DNA phosphorothioation-dependent restriction protein DptG